MKSKTRLIITISSVVLALIASAVAVVAVFAARNATAKATLNIKYTAVDVMGSVTMTTKREKESTYAAGGNVSFDGNEAENNTANVKSMTLGSAGSEYDISSDGSHYVILKFVFTNTNTAKAYTATITLPSDDHFRYKVNNANDTYASFATLSSSNNSVTVPVKSGATAGTATYYVLVEPKVTNASVTSTGKTISWALSSVIS